MFIDGNHSTSIVQDLDLAYNLLYSGGGMIVVDDYDNSNYPGVRTAVDAFLADTVTYGGVYGGLQWQVAASGYKLYYMNVGS